MASSWQGYTVFRGEVPVLYIAGISGASWVDESMMFGKPADKMGTGWSIWAGEDQTSDSYCVTNDNMLSLRVVLFWRKRLLRKVKAREGSELSDFVMTCAWEDSDG